MSIDQGQTEAGRSLGLNFSQTMRLIIIPQAFKNVLPALVNEFIVLIKRDIHHRLYRYDGPDKRSYADPEPYIQCVLASDGSSSDLPCDRWNPYMGDE